MSEVSSWNETDASNTAAPPDGWPEFMNPSDVNNCARAMMGAIKRWYNTVSAGIANALPLSGGEMTGPLTSNSNIVTSADVSCRTLYASSNVFAVSTVQASEIHSTGYVTADVDVNATGDVHCRSVYATNNVNAAGVLAGGSLSISGDGTIAGAVSLGSLAVTGNANVAGAFSANTAAATIITATSLVNAPLYKIADVNFAYRGSDVAGPLNTICDPTGFPAIDMYGVNGTYYRCDNAHFFTNRAATFNICRFQSGDGNCINISGLWNVVSDGAVKQGIAPYRAGLAEVLQLEPVSYRYTDDAPFGADGQLRYGLVAQDVEPILPEMITHAALSRAGSDETTDFATMAPGHLVFVLVNAVKEMAAKNAALEARLTQLEAGG